MVSSNQRRFSGQTAAEAVAAARAALGPDARIVAAERVSKPGLLGRKRHVVVTAEPMPVTSARDFAKELSRQLAAQEAEAPAEDLEILATAYEQAKSEPPQVVVAPIERREAVVVGSGGETRPLGSVERPQWSQLGDAASAAVRAVIDERTTHLTVDLSADGGDVVVDVSAPVAERAIAPEGSRVIAVCAPSVPYPLAAFDAVADRVGVGDADRFVLAQRRREIPLGLRSPADRVARAVASGQRRVAVLVDPGQLALLRSSFLAPLTWVVVAVSGDESAQDLEVELAACGPIDALHCVRSERAAVELGLAVVA